MSVQVPVNSLPAAGIGMLSKKIGTMILAFVTIIACASSASAQSVPPDKADSISSSATLSSRSPVAYNADAKKKKPADPNPSVAAMPASSATSFDAARQAQNPLTPLYSILNENSTNFRMGPLHGTQDVLLIEPVIPIRLTPKFNLIIRWITPVIWQPKLSPFTHSDVGLGNMAPQFFFTPAHEGNGFVWGLGANAWIPTETGHTLGVDQWGGGPTAVALWIQGPLLAGALVNQTWAGSHGSSLTATRIDQLSVRPIFFYNFSSGWYVASLPIFTADWTAPKNKWTVPLGGGVGRVIPIGNMIMNIRFDAYDNGLLKPAPGITNVGDWTFGFTLHFVFPNAKVPSLF